MKGKSKENKKERRNDKYTMSDMFQCISFLIKAVIKLKLKMNGNF
jgi:hypothetical protein